MRRDGEPVALTTREFALLEYLVRRAGQVVGKGELRDHVWDAAATDGLNVVEVYVAYLRQQARGRRRRDGPRRRVPGARRARG